MNEQGQQALREDSMEAVASAKERGMLCLWQAVIEQIADPEAMRTNVLLARKLLGGGTTSRRQRKWDRAPRSQPASAALRTVTRNAISG